MLGGHCITQYHSCCILRTRSLFSPAKLEETLEFFKRNVKMAKSKRNSLQFLSILFLLLNFMSLQVYSMDTVNLVDFCNQTIIGDGMIVNSHRESRKYYFVTIGTDCRLTMQAISPTDNIEFQFRFFLVYSLMHVSSIRELTTVSTLHELHNTTGDPTDIATSNPGQSGAREPSPTGKWELTDPCNAGSYLQFYDGKDLSATPIGQPLCGKTIPQPVSSTGNYLTLRLVTRGQQPRVDFVGDFTSFTSGSNSSNCSNESYFHCSSGKCIPASLVCDDTGIDNCGDGSDQLPHPPSNCRDPSSGVSSPKTDSTTTAQAASSLSSSSSSSTANLLCETVNKNQDHGPNTVPELGSIADDKMYFSLIALYIILGITAGIVLLVWCCWSPGWFVWRLSVCSAVPCCNSICAYCQLCTRSCSSKDNNRISKVTPLNTESPSSDGD
ncbi:low-density lipoprotein receptor class A domain-containing protein 2 [Protopterus annectens]|uniref:low-density lipoprotein receptor class A domain-containing protein 2 n=1 Tax=Protopterus annectens TaxID=7888 RepID=UPI001CFBE1E9|nr:low-density lipoprotein receptor class A domain-containing protein 2 [Protopterus annectens]